MAAKSLFNRHFPTVSVAEGATFLLLLCVAMPLKYAANLPIAVMIMGSVHGLLFIAYCLLALVGRTELGWTGKRFLWVLVMAVLPTGAFFAERSVKRELLARTAADAYAAATTADRSTERSADITA
jgi:integral membrane protein